MSTIFDKFSLKGQTAVVTGACGLLGKEFCRTLAQAGATVVAADITQEAVEKVVDEVIKPYSEGFAWQTNVVDPASVQALVARTVAKTGRLDVLVCSAAMDPKFDGVHGKHLSTFENFTLEQWNDALNVNLTGLFLCAQAAVEPMKAQNHGVIINICSTYGLVGPDQRIYERPGQDAESRQFKPVYYSVTKAGVLGLTRYLATYYAGTGIRANCLTPGGVYNGHDELFVKNYSARTVIGRMANIDELSGGLLFLASDASSYMTGSNLIVDGGWTAW